MTLPAADWIHCKDVNVMLYFSYSKNLNSSDCQGICSPTLILFAWSWSIAVSYCTPHGSLFMLKQYKRHPSREVLRTVFVCHRVPFLIPQAQQWLAEQCVGEGAGAQHAFMVFPAALKVRWGKGGEKACLIPEIPDAQSWTQIAELPLAACYERNFTETLCNQNEFTRKMQNGSLDSQLEINWRFNC